MRRTLQLSLLLLLISALHIAKAQVAIGTGTTAPTPNTSAVLFLEGNGSQGLIIPVGDRTTVANPTRGMLIFDTNQNQVYYNTTGTPLGWVAVGGGGSGSQGIQISGNTVSLTATPNAGFGLSSPAPTVTGQLLVWNGTGWESTPAPTTNGQTLSWNQTTGKWTIGAGATVATLSGDVQGASNSTTIANTAGNNIAIALNNAATINRILESRITPSGTNNQVLTTVGGVAQWANAPGGTLPSLSANQLLSNNGTNTGINVSGDLGLSVSGTTGTFTIANNAINTAKIINGAVTVAKIGTAGLPDANRVLTTDASGVPQWTIAAGGGDMLKSTYDPTNINGSAFNLSNHTGQISTTQITDANVTNAKLDKSAIPLSGFAAPTVAVDFGAQRITNLAAPTAATDATTKAYVDLADAAKLNATILTTSGDILYNDGTSTTRLPRGAIGNVLQSTATGIQWAPGGGSGEANTASNTGLGGVGVFDQKTGVNLELRNINAATNRIGVALDAANNEIDIDVNEANLSIATTQLTGQLGVANGGTGASTLPLNSVLLGNGTGAISAVTGGSPTNVLTLNASNIPVWLTVPGGVSAVSGSGPITVANGTSTPAISITQANASTPGFLSASDFSAFSAKQNALTFGDVTSGSTALTVTGGTGAAVGGNVTLSLNTGNAANQLVQLDGTGRLPAVDGSQLIGLPGGGDINGVDTPVGGGLIGGLSSGTPSLRLLNGSATGQILKWDNPTTSWVIGTDDVGSGSLPTLTDGQVIISVGANNPQGRVLQQDVSVDAASGNVTVRGLRGMPISATAPGANQVLKFNAGTYSPAADNDSQNLSVGGTGTVATGETFPLAITGGTGINIIEGTNVQIDRAGSNLTINTSGGGAPTGPATGDLAGSYPAPTINTASATTGANIITAVNTASAGTINTARLNTGVVLDTENPVAGDITGSYGAGFQIGAGVITGTDLTNNITISTTGSITGTNVSGNGSGLTSLNAGNFSTGTLAVARGGTGITAVTPGAIAYGGASNFAFTTAGTSGQLLQSNGAAAPTWVNAPTNFTTVNTVPKGSAGGLIASSIFDDGTYTGIGRTTPIGASRFDIQATGLGAGAYGGMYIQTDNTGWPFYGYSNNGGTSMWTYWNGGTGTWNVYNNGDRLSVTNTGNVGIGTISPTSKLDVSGDVRLAPIAAPSPTTDKLYNVGGSLFWNGTNISSGGSGWGLAGNATGLVDGAPGVGTNYLGTTVNVPLNFMVNNQRAGRIDPTATASTFFGYQAGNVTTGSENTGFGFRALLANTSGNFNAAIGFRAMALNTTGSSNTAVGNSALVSNNTGTDNAAVGTQALSFNTGGFNSALGSGALLSNTTGVNNTGVGYYALVNNTTGSQNTAVGYFSGRTFTPANANVTGSNNTFLGFNSGPGTSTQLTNATAIGANAVVNASNSLVLGNGVNVGIGTSTPMSKLNVSLGLGDLVNSEGDFSIGNSTHRLKMGVSGSGGGAGDAYIASQGGTNRLFLGTSNSLANSQTLTLTGGNVGIGTPSPTSALEVSSGGSSTAPQARIYQTNGADFGRLRFASAATASSYWDVGAQLTGTASSESLNFWNQAAGINVMSLRGSGQVTLANTDWNMNGLTLQSNATSAGASIRFTNPATGNRTYDIIGSSGTGADIGVGGFGIWDNTGSAYRFVIDNAGQVGIGTTTPLYKLHVVDAQAGSQVAKIENTSTATASDGLGILLNNTTASNDYVFFERTGGLVQGRIAANGSGAVQYLTASDLRLKTKITDYEGGLSAVLHMRPRNYVFKSSPEIPRVGFIAQELKTVFPEAVNGNEENDPEKEPMMVDYSKLSPVLVKAIQELYAKIEALEKENVELKGQLKIEVSAMKEKQQAEIALLKKQMEEVLRIVGAEAKKD